MNNYFIILASGQSKRFNSKKAKQFIRYKNKALFEHSVEKALSSKLFKKIILVVNDKKQTWLTLPINAKFGQKIKEVTVADKTWKTKHLSKITNAYKKTKYFLEIFNKIQNLFEEIDSSNLSVINQIK